VESPVADRVGGALDEGAGRRTSLDGVVL